MAGHGDRSKRGYVTSELRQERKFAGGVRWQTPSVTKNEWDTGRSAEVGSLLRDVQGFEGVAAVIEAMRTDLLAHPGAWENHDLDRFLAALAALTGSVDALMANRNETVPDLPSWSLMAELLVGASGYE